MDNLEEQIHNDLRQYLLSVKEIDARLPDCPPFRAALFVYSFLLASYVSIVFVTIVQVVSPRW